MEIKCSNCDFEFILSDIHKTQGKKYCYCPICGKELSLLKNQPDELLFQFELNTFVLKNNKINFVYNSELKKDLDIYINSEKMIKENIVVIFQMNFINDNFMILLKSDDLVSSDYTDWILFDSFGKIVNELKEKQIPIKIEPMDKRWQFNKIELYYEKYLKFKNMLQKICPEEYLKMELE